MPDVSQRFQRFFEATSDCQFYVQPDARGAFRYVHVNPAAVAVTGHDDPAQIIGLTPLEALGDDYGATVEANIRAAYDCGSPYHFRGSLGKDGGPVYDAHYYPLTADDGTVLGVLGSARDITELGTLNEQLKHHHKLELIGQLSSGIIHDFNNILTCFKSVLTMLDAQEINPARRRIILDEGNRAVENGIALTRRLTAFARKQPIKTQVHDVQVLLDNCRALIERVLGPAITLECRLAPGVRTAQCDHNEFQIAMMNLASNARDAMGGEGQVTVEARNGARRDDDAPHIPETFVEIAFGDAGCGMDPETLRRASDPFYTTKPEGHGTGLGLPSVFKFAHDIGGGVRIESAPGVGTTVSILLPIGSDGATAGRAPRQGDSFLHH